MPGDGDASGLLDTDRLVKASGTMPDTVPSASKKVIHHPGEGTASWGLQFDDKMNIICQFSVACKSLSNAWDPLEMKSRQGGGAWAPRILMEVGRLPGPALQHHCAALRLTESLSRDGLESGGDAEAQVNGHQQKRSSGVLISCVGPYGVESPGLRRHDQGSPPTSAFHGPSPSGEFPPSSGWPPGL